MKMVESLAAVTQLETKKSRAETYQTFYDLFGEQALARLRGHIVLSRVLHFDQDDRRDVHVIIGRHDQSMNLPIRRHYTELGLPAHRVPYRAEDFMAAATDGCKITSFEVQSVAGIYKNHLNGVDKQYNPEYETLCLRLVSAEGVSSGTFQYGSGNGVFDIQGHPTGWILSEPESLRIRQSVLSPGAIPDIGHVAVAS